MAPAAFDYSDPRAVARALAGCGCAPRTPARIESPPRAQGFVNTPGDYRLYLKQLKAAVEQIDLRAGSDPAWAVLKAQFGAVYDEYKDVGWTDFAKLTDTTWERLDDLNKALQGWADRLRKDGKDIGPMPLSPPPKPLAEQMTDAAKTASGLLGGSSGASLGDRLTPTLSTGTKWVLGLGAAALVLSQAKPLLERLPALRSRKEAPADPEPVRRRSP